MYCYGLKLLFLITQSYFPNQAETFIYSEVLGLHRAKNTQQAINYLACHATITYS